jgi:hypothetical protein
VHAQEEAQHLGDPFAVDEGLGDDALDLGGIKLQQP